MSKNLNPKEAEQKINDGNFTVIDVRTPGEFAEGYIEGALNIDISSPDFAEKIPLLDKDKNYLIYCRTGGRSSAAQGFMEKAGFKNAYNLAGGIMEWMKAGLRVINK